MVEWGFALGRLLESTCEHCLRFLFRRAVFGRFIRSVFRVTGEACVCLFASLSLSLSLSLCVCSSNLNEFWLFFGLCTSSPSSSSSAPRHQFVDEYSEPSSARLSEEHLLALPKLSGVWSSDSSRTSSTLTLGTPTSPPDDYGVRG